jgi:hypothetical protein
VAPQPGPPFGGISDQKLWKIHRFTVSRGAGLSYRSGFWAVAEFSSQDALATALASMESKAAESTGTPANCIERMRTLDPTDAKQTSPGYGFGSTFADGERIVTE